MDLGPLNLCISPVFCSNSSRQPENRPGRGGNMGKKQSQNMELAASAAMQSALQRDRVALYLAQPLPALSFSSAGREIIEINPAMQRLCGYSTEELPDLGAFINHIISAPQDREQCLAMLTGALPQAEASGRVARRAVTCLPRSKKIFRAELYVWTVTGGNGDGEDAGVAQDSEVRILQLFELSPAEVGVESGDVSVQNQAMRARVHTLEAELEQHKKWLELALDGIQEGLWVMYVANGKMDYIFTSILDMLGYSMEELDHSIISWDKLTHPDDIGEVKRRIKAHLKGETPHYESEFRALNKNGQWQWIMSHGQVTRRDAKGRALELTGVHVNIDKLKSIETELRVSENLFRTLVENLPVGIMLVDPDGDISYLNPRFIDLFGYTGKDLPGLDEWWEKACPSRTERKRLLAQIIGAEGKVVQTRLRCKSGEYKYVETQKVDLVSGEGILACMDVSEQVARQEELRERKQELLVQSKDLEEMNTALRVLLNKANYDREEMESKVYNNIRDLVNPYLEKLEQVCRNDLQRSYLDMVRKNLDEVVSGFTTNLIRKYASLTPREVQIANMIQQDMTIKEMAEALHISESSVAFHRLNIRKKMGLANKKLNLKTYLRSLE